MRYRKYKSISLKYNLNHSSVYVNKTPLLILHMFALSWQWGKLSRGFSLLCSRISAVRIVNHTIYVMEGGSIAYTVH